jgi:outer membrane protein TolC
LAQQVGTLKQTVDRSRSRYLSGQGAYLDVIVARESLQRLERRLVSERSKQLQIRATLYRALGGGGWVASLNKEEQKS